MLPTFVLFTKHGCHLAIVMKFVLEASNHMFQFHICTHISVCKFIFYFLQSHTHLCVQVIFYFIFYFLQFTSQFASSSFISSNKISVCKSSSISSKHISVCRFIFHGVCVWRKSSIDGCWCVSARACCRGSCWPCY